MKREHLRLMFMFAMCVGVLAVTNEASAFNFDNATKFAYIGELMEKDIVKGGVGWAAGLAGGAFAAYLAVSGKIFPTIAALGGTAIIANTPTLVKGMGAVIC